VLPHIWPTSYPPVQKPGQETRNCTQWFIGLIFAKSANLNVDLTFDIHTFTESVKRQASNLNLLKDGMDLDAKYVRKKDLSSFLPPEVIGKKKDEEGGKKRKKSTSFSEDTTPKKLKLHNENDETGDAVKDYIPYVPLLENSYDK